MAVTVDSWQYSCAYIAISVIMIEEYCRTLTFKMIGVFIMKGKKILLCVTGGIAVYKAVTLTSKLTQAGCDVKVIMTESATKFVSPLTFQVMSRNDVYTDVFDEKDSSVIAHIDLADWADLVLVAPATANFIGKISNGIADDMVTTTLLATTAEVWVAPAMNGDMYHHPAVQKNMKTLVEFGYKMIEPQEGLLACGYVGKGRLEEPEAIVELLQKHFTKKTAELNGKKILITAGPTKEKIDPVRYLTNRSSGKMGFALAEAALDMGAEVILISGSELQLKDHHHLTYIKVESANEMYEAVMKYYSVSDVVIKSAAVADYTPIHYSNEKIKKKGYHLVIELEKTKDILLTLGENKQHQFLIGFAAETNNIKEHALQKLKKKNLDMVVVNDVTQKGAGFDGDTNIVTIINKNREEKQLPLLSKYDTAKEILTLMMAELKDGCNK